MTSDFNSFDEEDDIYEDYEENACCQEDIITVGMIQSVLIKILSKNKITVFFIMFVIFLVFRPDSERSAYHSGGYTL